MNSAINSMQFIDFPKLSPAKRKLMSDVSSTLHKNLSSLLNLSQTPPNVQFFQTPDGNSQGSVIIKSGKQGSKISYMLGSWLHSTLPFGPLNITTIQITLQPETDAPHFLLEFIQTGYNSLVLVLDNVPRKDLVLDPEYLTRFYENTNLDEPRSRLQKLVQCETYVSPSLFIRSFVSPTGILCKFKGETEDDLDKLVNDDIYPCVMDVATKWLRGFNELGKPVINETELSLVKRRDDVIRMKALEIDLSSNLPKLFGQEIADRVIAAFLKAE